MSNEITTAMVDTFNTGIEMLAQQMSSKLKGRVRVESKPGKRNAFDQVGSVAVSQVTVRHEDTRYINSPHRRRWVGLIDFDVADLLDKEDVIRILNDPSGEYIRAFVAAFNRQRDQSILEAALATAYTGEDGTGTQAMLAANQIAAGGDGFTLAKVKSAMRILKAGSAVEADMDGGDFDLTVAWTSFQEEEFLDTTEVKSIDYNTQKVLVDGGMGNGKFYGFNYVRLEDWTDDVTGTKHRIVAHDGVTTRSCVAWKKDGLLLNEPRPPYSEVDRMPGKRQSTQLWVGGSFGATRMQEPKVVQIDCVEAA